MGSAEKLKRDRDREMIPPRDRAINLNSNQSKFVNRQLIQHYKL
jgi:hypothetical protein